MISVITCWPNSFDFPLFRSSIPELLTHVDEVLICFTKHGNHDLSDWIKKNLNGVRYFNEPENDHTQDWRSRSTNLMLNNVKGNWILSLEQDFMIYDYSHFFNKVKKAMETHDVVMFPEDQRYHPAFLMVKKDFLLRTKRDFSVMGDGRDHFHQITKELKGLNAKTISLQELDLLPDRDWYHYQGMTDNEFAPKPYFKLDEFCVYNEWCYRLYKNGILDYSDYWVAQMDRLRHYPDSNFESSKSYKMLCRINKNLALDVKQHLNLLLEDQSIV